MEEERRSFVPAAGLGWLLPIYDPLQKLLGADAALRELLEQGALRPGQRVLDIGCGTGTLAVLIKGAQPEVEVTGIDPDPQALDRARQKAARARVEVQLDGGYSERLPYADASFDRVFSSFMLHHLAPDAKVMTLEEARRVLAPGGSLHVLDFGGAEPRRDGLIARVLHSHEHVRDHFEGGLPARMKDAGFVDAREVGHRKSLFGRIAYYSARKPG